MMEATMAQKWFIEADYLQACSCEYGCPCEFQAPPSQGFCEGVGAWNITKGKYGEVTLDGLGLAFAARWPQALHLGNGTAALFFDERATDEQRNALMQIATGQAGGMPFEILVTTLTNVLPPQYVPFTFDINGKNSRAKIGDAVSIGLTPIKNPVTGEPESSRIEHETGFVFKTADVVAGEVCNARVNGLTFSWPNKAGFVASIRYGN
jgi:hypothetical protein